MPFKQLLRNIFGNKHVEACMQCFETIFSIQYKLAAHIVSITYELAKPWNPHVFTRVNCNCSEYIISTELIGNWFIFKKGVVMTFKLVV